MQEVCYGGEPKTDPGVQIKLARRILLQRLYQRSGIDLRNGIPAGQGNKAWRIAHHLSGIFLLRGVSTTRCRGLVPQHSCCRSIPLPILLDHILPAKQQPLWQLAALYIRLSNGVNAACVTRKAAISACIACWGNPASTSDPRALKAASTCEIKY
ncbi:MAG: hypothetical protein FRX49_13070 [Trebouxia sp. A1-2]|nr:MAG: hypothetical protein FRX49_13070 [Trebouxia sp. A1-2]